MANAAKTLDEIAEQINAENNKLPPVEQWNPQFSGDMDIVINREGEWFHEGSRFERKALVKLFASILKKEGDEYYLVTPVEKFRIQVTDLPFVVTQMETIDTDSAPVIKFTTNIGDEVIADQAHPLLVDHDKESMEPQPRILVRRNLYARIHRNVFYELVRLAEEESGPQGNQMVVHSGERKFILGHI